MLYAINTLIDDEFDQDIDHVDIAEAVADVISWVSIN